MANDGSIRIGVDLETDKFDKQVQQLEKKLQKEEQKSIEIDAKIADVQEEIQFYEEIAQKAENYRQVVEKIQKEQASGQGELTARGREVLENYAELKTYLEENAESYAKLTSEQEKLLTKQTDINGKVAEYKTQIESVKLQKATAEANKMKEGFKSIGDSIQGAVQKAGKLVLGVFAIRSAYMALRRASSDLASYDKEYASNLEYIRYVLTETIAPVLKWIIQLASTLLNYLFQILNAWFGLNLGKSAKDFEAMKKSSGGVAKNMKEAEKATQGFDELNVLQDNSQTGGGGGGYTAPTLDMSGMQGEPPAWLQWIIDNKDLVLTALGAILGAIIGLKTGLGGIAGLGIGVMVAGVVALIGDLVDFIKDPSWEKFGRVLKDIGVAITGLGIAIGALTGNWLVALIGLLITVVGLIIENWDSIQKVLSEVGGWIYDHIIKPVVDFFDALGKWLWNNFIQPVIKFFQSMGETLGNIFKGIGEFFGNVFRGAWEGIQNVFRNVGNFFQGIWNTIVSIFRNIGQRIGEAVSGAFKGAVNAIFTVLENILNFPIRAINGLISLINMIPGVNLGKLNEFHLPRLKTGGIINMPNKGTMVGGSAIGGESGREGVIPLTDSQAMETLGESIGKYVTINATINNTMDGKLISRHIQKIQSQQAFAGNF